MSEYDRRSAPATEEGWYALHDLRRIDWDGWRAAPQGQRDRALEEGVSYLRAHEALEDIDGDTGGSAVFSVLGHSADLLILHLRPTTEALDRAARAFEGTAFAGFTERASSYVSVTEVSGYVTEEVGEGVENIESHGTRNYLRQRLYPTIPDAEHVCFYPMNKRRGPADNWYDLPFEERADIMAGHGEVGREYAGDVTQIITGSLGFDDHEWGVTLFADDPTAIKHLLYDMRFDPSSSRFAEFGPFTFGRRFPPEDLPALLAGERIPTDVDAGTRAASDPGEMGTGMSDSKDAEKVAHADENAAESNGDGSTGREPDHASGYSSADGVIDDSSGDRSSSSGRPSVAEGEPLHEDVETVELERELQRIGVSPDVHPGTGYVVVVYSHEDAEVLVDEVEGLRGNFDHYDTHVATLVRADSGRSAVASLWANERAANTASGFLFDLPGVERGVGGPLEVATDAEPDDDGGDGSSSPDGGAVRGTDDGAGVRSALDDLDVYAGQPHGEDVYAMVVYSEANADELFDAATDLRERFDQYDTHVRTSVYEAEAGSQTAVVSLWDTRDAAGKAGGYLADLPGVVAHEPRSDADGASGDTARPPSDGDGFGTMGMFYTVKEDHREAFVDRFETVGGLLDEMAGHEGTDLFVNYEDAHDMFIASRWASKADAMAFFRSEAFRDTVEWGREVLADRPRHVFLT